MAIFVHNNPSTAIGQGPPPPPDTFINTLHQLRRERQDQANRSRELDINEKRYQDYLKFREEELAAKKAVEDRLVGQEDTAYNRQLEQERILGQQQHNTATNLINQINSEKRDLMGRITQAASKIQELNALKAANKPVDAHQLSEWERIVKDLTNQVAGLDRSAQSIAGQLRHGQILHVNSRTGEYALSEPILPGGRTAVGSNAGPLRAGPLSEAPEIMGTPATIPGRAELSGGTGESIPLPQRQPQPIQRQQMTGVIPSFYRDVSPSVRAMASGAGQRFSEYAKNVGNFVGSTPYRYWFSGEPMDVTINRPEIRQPGFSEEAPALAERIGRAFLDKFRSQPSPEDNSLKALIDRAAADRAAAAATDRGPFAPSISDEELRRIINPTYFLGY